MKKRFYLLLLSVFVIFSSCKDKSGEYTEQLFTNAQITMALKECIRTTADATLNTLCVTDTTAEQKYGFYYYEEGEYKYRLELANVVVDTLRKYDYDAQIDELILNINRAAEKCGNNIKSLFLNPMMSNITFPNPNAVLHGGNTAITDFVKTTKQTEFMTLLTSNILAEQFKTLDIVAKWNNLQEEYYKKTGNYASIEILPATAQQLVNQFFKRMGVVETAVRKDPTLRGNPNGLFYKVFATL